MRPKHETSGGPSVEDIEARYRDYPVTPLSYGTVRDYCDSFDHLRTLATANGDLKDQERPWTLKAVLSQVKKPGGRLLEIGAGEPLVADFLRQLGYEVWIVDPYDGSGNGPRDYKKFKSTYKNLKFVRDQFGDKTPGLDPGSFDCIYSISVLEHIPHDQLQSVMAGMKRFLKPDGVSLHAVDHVHRGNDAEKHLKGLRLMTAGFGLPQKQLDSVLAAMTNDVDTYYLSAESHNRWRGGVPYDDFPMRVCVNVQFCTPASQLKPELAAL